MVPFTLTLATLSMLVLAAHFLRDGDWITTLCVLVCTAMLHFQRQRWVARLTQVLLALGACVWVATLLGTYQARVAEGGDPRRLAAILAAVAAADVVAAVLLGTRQVLARYPSGSTPPSPEPPAR